MNQITDRSGLQQTSLMNSSRITYSSFVVRWGTSGIMMGYMRTPFDMVHQLLYLTPLSAYSLVTHQQPLQIHFQLTQSAKDFSAEFSQFTLSQMVERLCGRGSHRKQRLSRYWTVWLRLRTIILGKLLLPKIPGLSLIGSISPGNQSQIHGLSLMVVDELLTS